MMVKLIGRIILFSLVFYSCAKDNETVINFPLKDFHLIHTSHKVRLIDDYRGHKFLFKYNSNGTVSTVEVPLANDTALYMECYYDRYNRLIQSNEYDWLSDIGLNWKDSFEYLKDQVILTETVIFPDEQYQLKTILYYNNLGECIRVDKWQYDPILGKTIFTGNYKVYTWKDNNVASLTEYYHNAYSHTLKFEYDTLANPVRGLSNCLIPDLAYGTHLSKNRITSSVNVDANITINYKYEGSQDSVITRYYYSNSNQRWVPDLRIEFE